MLNTGLITFRISIPLAGGTGLPRGWPSTGLVFHGAGLPRGWSSTGLAFLGAGLPRGWPSTGLAFQDERPMIAPRQLLLQRSRSLFQTRLYHLRPASVISCLEGQLRPCNDAILTFPPSMAVVYLAGVWITLFILFIYEMSINCLTLCRQCCLLRML